ncbi:FitA-like ribbon-helix-helix domain-containing protein [Halochromatium salexigens]|uniref:Plasmid stabilization protein n=1 Tax=Halochromatium salexigens TaxID=49447 RepID=A0AAJ0XGR3_HALSE|nr:plasmid stabilization protein [Halochromatium salexigens]MBK5931005.1 plasmid stabilization protein [Halochromatium salexigens]
MASMTIHHIDDQIQDRLRARATLHGHSMEDEAREILRSALFFESAEPPSLAQSIRSRIEPLGGVELDVPAREAIREATNLAS